MAKGAKKKPPAKSAKKQAGKKKPEQAERPMQTMSPQRIRDLARMFDTCKDRQSTAAGELGSVVRQWQEDYGLDMVAFRLAKRFHSIGKRDPAILDLRMVNFDHYMEALGVEKMRQPSLPGVGRVSTRKRKVDEQQPTAEASAETTHEDTAEGFSPPAEEPPTEAQHLN